MQLKLERIAARVDQQDLADRLKKTRQTVGKYESQEVVKPEVAEAYRAALATFAEVASVA